MTFCAFVPSALARKMSPERAKAILPVSPGKAASAGRARDVPREAASTAAATARNKGAVGLFRGATLRVFASTPDRLPVGRACIASGLGIFGVLCFRLFI